MDRQNKHKCHKRNGWQSYRCQMKGANAHRHGPSMSCKILGHRHTTGWLPDTSLTPTMPPGYQCHAHTPSWLRHLYPRMKWHWMESYPGASVVWVVLVVPEPGVVLVRSRLL